MRNQSELISVLICTHNRCDVLGNALNSLEKMNPGEHLAREVVVVDNASVDRTREIVEEFAAKSSKTVRYIHEARLGHSQALNTGIEHCGGSIVAFTDDDAVVSPHWLDQIAATFHESDAGIVFGQVDPLWETAPPPWFTRRDYGRFALLDYGPQRFVVTDVEHPFYGVNVAVRRDVLNSLGGYRTDIGPRGIQGGIGADTDLFERALASGVGIVYDPSILVRHFIPTFRCTKTFHREKIKNCGQQYYEYVREYERCLPHLAGLPRYRYGRATKALVSYLKHMVTGKEAERFHNELELRRFFWLVVHAFGRSGLRA
jgi:glycosyltransferase involved in cell wall biosynthesis